MVDKKNKTKGNSAGGCPTQGSKSSRQVSKLGISLPVKLSKGGWCRCWCSSKRDGDDGFSRANTRWVTSSDEGLGLDKEWKSWLR